VTQTYASMSAHPLGTRPNIKTPIAPPLTGTIKICCIGTSETYGAAGYLDSYRLQLYKLLTERGGLTISMIGFQTQGTAPADKSHGITGSTTVDRVSGGTYDLATAARNLGTTYVPDVIIYEDGTNDATGALVAGFQANYLASIAYQKTLCPSARWVLLTVPVGGDATRRGHIDTINATFPAIVVALDAIPTLHVVAEGRQLTFPGDQAASETPSNLHWNTAGQLKIADALFPAVMNACGYAAVW